MTTVVLPTDLDLPAALHLHSGDVIDLSIGDPADPTPQEFKDGLSALLRNPRVDHYPDPIGDFALLEAVGAYYRRRFGITLDPGTDICVTAGALPALSLALRAAPSREQVCGYAEPAYFGIPHAIRAAGMRPFAISLEVLFGNGERLLESFAQFAGGCFILNSPHNPTGRVLSGAQLAAIAEAARANRVGVVADAVYIELFGSEMPGSFLEFNDAAVEVCSFSKTFRMCGWRCGFVSGKGEWIHALRDLRDNADNGVAVAIQVAAASLLRDMTGVAEFRNEINGRRQFLARQLLALGFGVDVARVGGLGTNFLWAKIPATVASSTEASALLSSVGVKVVSGSIFGAAGEGFLRFSLNCPILGLKDAVTRIEKVLSGMH